MCGNREINGARRQIANAAWFVSSQPLPEDPIVRWANDSSRNHLDLPATM